MNDSASTNGMSDASDSFGRRLTRALIVIAILVVSLAAGLAIYFWNVGSFVVVKNDASVVARGVVIRVAGETISLGDLPPGATRRRRLCPTGPSNVVIEFKDSGGYRSDWDFEYRFEPDEQVTFEFGLRDNGVSAWDSRKAK